MSTNPISEPAFVSVDLESSLGIIQDENEPTLNSPNISSSNLICQPIDGAKESPVLVNVFEETLPMVMMENCQKVTRTSDTYPFANQQSQETSMNEGDEGDDVMDESDCSPVHEKDTQDKASGSPQTSGMSLDPIPVSDQAGLSDFNMMMLLQDDDEAKQVLVNRIGGDWNQYQEQQPQQNENGYYIVPNDNKYMNWVNDNIDLSETEVEEDDDTLLDIMEKEAKESGFVELESIQDRQSFWGE